MEALGHGNAAHLISIAQAHADATPQKVLSAAALAACSGSTYANNAGRALGRASAAEDARKCLLKAPMLSELHEWSSWHLLFEQELGSLSSFLQDQGAPAIVFSYLAEVPMEQFCLSPCVLYRRHLPVILSLLGAHQEDQAAHHEQYLSLIHVMTHHAG